MVRSRIAACAVVGLAAAGCGRDYYYVGHVEVQGDTLVVEFLETCPSATLRWDGMISEGQRIDLSVDALGDGCTGSYDASFDLRPPRWALVERNPNAFGILLVRIAGFDVNRGPDCALYNFLPSHPTRPGSESPIKCP